MIRAARTLMDRARDEFLPCAALTENQNGRVRRRDAFDEPEDVTHLRRSSDDVTELLLYFERLFQFLRAVDQCSMFGGLRNCHCDRVSGWKRLGEKVIRTCFHSSHGGIHVG